MTTATENPVAGFRPPGTVPGPAVFSVLPWIDEAACRGRGDLFFGPSGERPEQRDKREARARLVCLDCPVLEPCRHWARGEREYGFWGGESEEERVAAGYPVAMPIGRVAKAAQMLRQRILDETRPGSQGVSWDRVSSVAGGTT